MVHATLYDVKPHLVRPACYMRTADASALRELARPLPYDRARLAPGTPVGPPDAAFTAALLATRAVHFDGSGTPLGDALLGLAHLEAIRDAASLIGIDLKVTATPELASILGVPAAQTTPAGAVAVSAALEPRAGALMPRREPPLVRNGHRVFADLPSRRYLDVEARLGLRLPRNEAFLPSLHGRDISEHARPFVCYIAASAWAEKKDYGIGGFASVARCIDATTAGAFDHLLVQGFDDERKPAPPLRAISPDARHLGALIALFARATLVIGNDTGLLHAAAMTHAPHRAAVIGIYGRHSFFRFTTAGAHAYAIATPFSQAMALTDRSPVRDDVNDDRYPRAASVRRIPPEFVAECAMRVLAAHGW